MSGVQYVFGYGSLVATRDGHVTQLRDHERRWGVAMDNTRDLPGYKYYVAPDGTRPAVFVAFLDVAPAPGASVSGVCSPVDLNALTRARRARAQLRAPRRHRAARRPARPDVGLRGFGGRPRAPGPRRGDRDGRHRRRLPARGPRRRSGHSPRWTPATCPCARYGASTSSPASLRSSPFERPPLLRRSAARTARRRASPTTSRARSSSRPPAGVRWIARLRRSCACGAALGQPGRLELVDDLRPSCSGRCPWRPRAPAG